MIIAHIMGIPVEESVLALAPAGAAVTGVTIAVRANLDRLLRRRPDHGMNSDPLVTEDENDSR